MPARILICDIETAPIVAQVWNIWDQNIGLNQIEHDWSILSYCAKWLGKDELFYKDTGGKGVKRVRNDKPLLKDIWTLLDAADIVVAQNGKKFDVRKINARLIQQGFLPYSPIRIIDTATEARKHFGFTSNKLAYLSEKLTDTPKSEHRNFPGHELWTECLKDNPDAWKEMRVYNPTDVIATEQVYLRMRPWIAGHPNLAAYHDATELSCPKCAGTDLQFRGVAVSQVGRYRRFQCKSCGGWGRSRANALEKEKRNSLAAN